MRYGKWETIKELGAGGQGTAYLARDTSVANLDRDIYPAIRRSITEMAGIMMQGQQDEKARTLLENIAKYQAVCSEQHHAALKVLHPHILNDKKAQARMAQEVETLQKHPHPHIITILDASVSEGWFVTGYHSAGTLAQNAGLFAGNPLKALDAFMPLVDAVATLHQRNIVHRDIKPDNIFVSDGRLILGDFGLVFFMDDAKSRISETYENVGSRDWMPAWAQGFRVEEIKPSFDVFSLGKVLWAMVSGKTKFPLWYHKKPDYDLVRLLPNESWPHLINALLDGCVKEEDQDVYPSATELLAEVERVRMILQRGGQLIRRDTPRYCAVCGYGVYRYEDSGVRRVGNPQWRSYVCNKCGHVQTFQIHDNPEAWGPDGPDI